VKQKGDLVKFYSSYEPFMRDYYKRNPGLILRINTSSSIEVMWADGSITTEHATYIISSDSKVSIHVTSK